MKNLRYSIADKRRLWTVEMIEWLRDNRRRCTLAETARDLNAHFDTDVTLRAVANICARHGICGSRDGRFRPGHRPWNTGMAGLDIGGDSARYRFRPGHQPHSTEPVGTYVQGSDGYWKLKVRETTRAGESRRNWCYVHRLTWEAVHGPVPRGHVIVFFDADPNNCLEIDNLACIDRATLIRLNQLGWSNLNDPAARRAMIEVARLSITAHRRARMSGMSRRERRRIIQPLRKIEP